MVTINATGVSSAVIFAVDSNIEHQNKLILLGMILLFCFLCILYSKRLDMFDKYWARLLKKSLLIFSYPFIILSPLFSFFLYRQVSFDKLYTIVLSFYGVAIVLAFITSQIWFWEVVGEYLEKIGFKAPKFKRYNK
jgi:Na+-transporting methylmalonyl-CoA/oxaloacetate decarboxylase gamma subunit